MSTVPISDLPGPQGPDTPPTDPPPAGRRSLLRRVGAVDELGVLVALIAILVFVSVFHPDFVNMDSIANLSQQAAFYGLIALGMVFVLSMGGIDLSVGSIFGFTAVIIALLARDGMNLWLAAVLAIVAGGALGAINGMVANVLKLPLIIITLGTLSMYRGLTLVISGGNNVAGGDPDSSFFSIVGGEVAGLPAAAVAFVIAAVGMWFVYRNTRFGYAVRAVGSNEHAARLSGYPIGRIRVQVTILVGALCGLAGVLAFGFFGSSDPSLGNGYELQAIAAAIIGGTALSGGKGSILGAVLGALIISVINGALTTFGVSANWSGFVTGAVIILAVALDSVIKRRQVTGAV